MAEVYAGLMRPRLRSPLRSSTAELQFFYTWICAMRPDVLDVKVGDVVAVNQPGQKPYLAQLLYLEVVPRLLIQTSCRPAAWA